MMVTTAFNFFIVCTETGFHCKLLNWCMLFGIL